MGSISHHIMLLVISSLGGGDTHTHTNTASMFVVLNVLIVYPNIPGDMETHIQTFADRSNSKKPGVCRP